MKNSRKTANEQGERRFAIRTFRIDRAFAPFRDGCAISATAIALVLAAVASVVEIHSRAPPHPNTGEIEMQSLSFWKLHATTAPASAARSRNWRDIGARAGAPVRKER
ncbi:Hypothetical protein BN69_0081 [Methylocystis sp. SC2]|nr:Hypothetical protein BN69_0081 [Methylocystis sp. SC2]